MNNFQFHNIIPVVPPGTCGGLEPVVPGDLGVCWDTALPCGPLTPPLPRALPTTAPDPLPTLAGSGERLPPPRDAIYTTKFDLQSENNSHKHTTTLATRRANTENVRLGQKT